MHADALPISLFITLSYTATRSLSLPLSLCLSVAMRTARSVGREVCVAKSSFALELMEFRVDQLQLISIINTSLSSDLP